MCLIAHIFKTHEPISFREHCNAVWFSTRLLKAKFRYAILVAGRSEAGRRPVTSWNLAYRLAR